MEAKTIKGYKIFNPNWTCRGFQFEVGKIYKEDVKPMVCDKGFHFCEKAADCFNYYQFNPENKVAEVIALGEVDSDGVKSCTDKIQIVREVPWDELLRVVNTGKDCTGFCNAGDCNTGNYNTGDCNTGNSNTGYSNTGNRNTGSRNTGNYNTGGCNTGNSNTGYCNTGDWNTGDHNAGDLNTGDWNKSSFNTGCFNTTEQKLIMFNKPSNWTREMWIRSDARYLLNQIPRNVVKWIYSEDMTDEEKAEHPTHETTGGYLKVLDESECGQIWWNNLSEPGKNIIKSLPNFDADIFEECTGIKIN